jgi:UDP-glucuronate 4-epimerase
VRNNILVTGCAGFIGYHLTKNLLKNYNVVGIDNLNNYYSIKLKKDRLFNLKSANFKFYKISILNKKKLNKIFLDNNIQYVFHLAAQAGVRFSLKKPSLYLKNNIEGFLNILESCREFKIKHLIYASSSSVYGNSQKKKLSVFDITNNPNSIYAVTKKTNELMAKCYFNLFKLNSTGLRFFTVYGPFGRPDMSLNNFVKNIIKDKNINLFNNGDHVRSFTYIDDAINQIRQIFIKILNNKIKRFHVFNVSDGKSYTLKKYVSVIENILEKKSKKRLMPLQRGDVKKTVADIAYNKKFYSIKKTTDIKFGIQRFIDWFKKYY